MITHQLENYLNELVKTKGFNGAVLVSKGQEEFFCKGYGYANIEHEILNHSNTKFRIGSITKSFTAMAVLLLQEAGELSTGEYINKYFDGGSSIWSSIKIRHLLTHTSGLMHPWDSVDFESTIMLETTLDETIDCFKHYDLLSNPGEKYHYSGLGYFMLARIIEKVSGETFGDFLQINILDPLEMADTGEDNYKNILANRASGYMRKKDCLQHSDWIYMPLLTGGGNLYSTLGDLGKWDRALTSKKLLSDISYEEMYTVCLNNYAYGWQIFNDKNGIQLRHSGGAPGFSAHILRIQSCQICIIVFSNIVRNHHNPNRVVSIANNLLSILYHAKKPD